MFLSRVKKDMVLPLSNIYLGEGQISKQIRASNVYWA